MTRKVSIALAHEKWTRIIYDHQRCSRTDGGEYDKRIDCSSFAQLPRSHFFLAFFSPSLQREAESLESPKKILLYKIKTQRKCFTIYFFFLLRLFIRQSCHPNFFLFRQSFLSFAKPKKATEREVSGWTVCEK